MDIDVKSIRSNARSSKWELFHLLSGLNPERRKQFLEFIVSSYFSALDSVSLALEDPNCDCPVCSNIEYINSCFQDFFKASLLNSSNDFYHDLVDYEFYSDGEGDA